MLDDGQKVQSWLASASTDQSSEKRVLPAPLPPPPHHPAFSGTDARGKFSLLLLICVYLDFRNPTVELLKNPSTFVSQKPLPIAFSKPLASSYEVGALWPLVSLSLVSHFGWLWSLFRDLGKSSWGEGRLFLKALSSSMCEWSGQSCQCLKQTGPLDGKTYPRMFTLVICWCWHHQWLQFSFCLSVFSECSLWKKEPRELFLFLKKKCPQCFYLSL